VMIIILCGQRWIASVAFLGYICIDRLGGLLDHALRVKTAKFEDCIITKNPLRIGKLRILIAKSTMSMETVAQYQLPLYYSALI